MKSKQVVRAVISVLLLAVAACGPGKTNAPSTPAASGTQPASQRDTSQKSGDSAAAALPPGATAEADGFVRLPGEPSRHDTAYVLTGDVCEQFTAKYMESLTGKRILRTSSVTPGSAVCQYFISAENKNMMFQVAVDWRNVDNQKAAFEFLKWRVTPEPRIPMNNFVVYQENGRINKIYLVLAPAKFVTLDRSAADALTESEMMNLAVKLGGKLKNFK